MKTNSISGINEQLYSFTKVDAQLEKFAVSNVTVQSAESTTEKTLNFESNVFVPSPVYLGVLKQRDRQQVFANEIQLISTVLTLPSVSMPTKLHKMVFDKFCGNVLEWLNWFGQYLATNDKSGATDSVKITYLKNLVTGNTKEAVEGMRYCSQMYHAA